MANKTAEPTLNPDLATVVFVPFFGGKRPLLKKHFDFVESLGFPWVFVDLDFSLLKFIYKPFSSQSFSFGMKKIWADQIEKSLNEIPGKKIIYAFSNPSAGAIEAVARRGAHDIVAVICEGGPSGELFNSILNYYQHELPISNFVLRRAATWLSTHMISLHPEKINYEDLEKFPSQLPLLSVRGWKDPLISPQQIDKIFEPHANLNWRKLNLPLAKHLNGLKDFREEYVPAVTQFLMATKSPSSVGISKDL